MVIWYSKMSKLAKISTIIMVAYPDRGAGNVPKLFLPPWQIKGGYVFGSVGLSVCLSVCVSVCLSVDNITQNVMNGFGWNFMDWSLSSTRKNWLNFGGDLGIVRWVNEQKNTIIVVAYPDRGEGNDPEPFFFFFFRGVGSLSPPRLNIFTLGNMGVMICLDQGGLHSLSASSFL